MRRPQAERSESTKRAIVTAARGLFGANGYDATPIDEIAEAAGVSKGALYHHYRDKAEVLAAVYEVLEEELAGRLVGAGRPGDAPLALLAAGSRRFLDICVEPEYRQIALVDAPATLGWERWRAIDGSAGGFGLLQAGLQAAVDAGEIADEHVDERAHLLLASLMEAALLVGRSDDPEATRDVVSRLIDAQLESFRRASDAPAENTKPA